MNCKIVGEFVQHLMITLNPQESFYAEKGALIYLENGIDREMILNSRGLVGLIGAKLSGENFFIVRFTNTSNQPKQMAIGSTFGIHHIKINGESLICHRGVYIASSNQVDISTKLSITGLIGGAGLLFQTISGNATVFLDSMGPTITIDLKPNEIIEADEEHLIALQAMTTEQVKANWSLKNIFTGEDLSVLKITGPGRVYLTTKSLDQSYGSPEPANKE